MADVTDADRREAREFLCSLIEPLSRLEHQRWADWMRYQWSAPDDKRADWPRKVATPYDGLTVDEQDSDRIEARKAAAVIEPSLASLLASVRERERARIVGIVEYSVNDTALLWKLVARIREGMEQHTNEAIRSQPAEGGA